MDSSSLPGPFIRSLRMGVMGLAPLQQATMPRAKPAAIEISEEARETVGPTRAKGQRNDAA